MSQRLSMKFTGANSNNRIVPIMKLNMTKNASTPKPNQVTESSNNGVQASAWRRAAGNGESFSLKKGCGCGG